MPLSPPVSRQLRHRRAIRADAYEREDGLWDIEACLTDDKPRDVALASGVRPNGSPIHELWLRITIDRKLNVVDAEASSDWVPYPGLCQASNPAYRALIGCKTFVAMLPVCWPARQVARISPSCAQFCRLPPSRRSRATCGIPTKAGQEARSTQVHAVDRQTVQPEARRAARDKTPKTTLQAGKQANRRASNQTTNRHSSWAAAMRCGSTVRRCDSFIRAGTATRRVQRIARMPHPTDRP